MISDEDIARTAIREWWSYAQGAPPNWAGWPWSIRVQFPGHDPTTLGDFWMFLALMVPVDKGGGLNAVYGDIMANHGGDDRVRAERHAFGLPT